MHHHWAKRKGGTEPVDYSIFTHDPAEQAAIATVLAESLAVPVFQEQLMRPGDVAAGFGAGTRDRLSKGISKKKQAEIDAVGELWFAGAGEAVSRGTGEPKIGFSPASANALWDAIKEAGK